MRWAYLAASIAALSAGMAAPVLAQDNKDEPRVQQTVVQSGAEPAQELRVTSPPNAAPDRTYEDPSAALLEADVDYLVREGRRRLTNDEAGEQASFWSVAVFADDFAAGRFEQARATLTNAPGGLQGGVADMLEPFLLAAEGQIDRAVERVDAGGDNLPAPLPEVARAMLFESAGRLNEAAAVYSQMAERLDLTPPGDSEPQSVEEFERALSAVRVTHAIYRAALVQHRLGHTAEARRLYNIVEEFAPRSADVRENVRRLDAGQQPFEAPLNAKSAAGRWMIFLSEFLTQTETLAGILSEQDPEAGLSSMSGTTLLQIGLLLSPDAGDWRLYAAQQVLQAGGEDGAERIVTQMASDSPFAADAEIMRAGIQIERGQHNEAVATAQRAQAQAGDRWSLIAAAGDVYRRAQHSDQAVAAYTQALSMVQTPKDRADVLGWRAYAHRYSGNIPAATADMRAAFEIDQSVDTRLLYVSILMDDPQAWNDGIRVARGLFAEQPDSVMRLNALGYALIQRPEGLEEGYRLLWRGFNFGQQDYSVVDSLGWAYYLYGHFDQARALIERANDLSVANPNAEILDHLGDIYWRLDRRDDARGAWRRALDADPDAIRRRSLEQKVRSGLREAAPRRRDLPRVDLPDAPAQREDL
jgi:tetratricopeptide (TPR) repeat protein